MRTIAILSCFIATFLLNNLYASENHLVIDAVPVQLHSMNPGDLLVQLDGLRAEFGRISAAPPLPHQWLNRLTVFGAGGSGASGCALIGVGVAGDSKNLATGSTGTPILGVALLAVGGICVYLNKRLEAAHNRLLQQHNALLQIKRDEIVKIETILDIKNAPPAPVVENPSN